MEKKVEARRGENNLTTRWKIESECALHVIIISGALTDRPARQSPFAIDRPPEGFAAWINSAWNELESRLRVSGDNGNREGKKGRHRESNRKSKSRLNKASPARHPSHVRTQRSDSRRIRRRTDWAKCVRRVLPVCPCARTSCKHNNYIQEIADHSESLLKQQTSVYAALVALHLVQRPWCFFPHTHITKFMHLRCCCHETTCRSLQTSSAFFQIYSEVYISLGAGEIHHDSFQCYGSYSSLYIHQFTQSCPESSYQWNRKLYSLNLLKNHCSRPLNRVISRLPCRSGLETIIESTYVET